MSYYVSTPDAVESVSTPSSVAPLAPSSPIITYDTRPGSAPGAVCTYTRSPVIPTQPIQPTQSAQPASLKRPLELLEYPTVYKDLQFCRDVRDEFKAYERENPHATALDREGKALESLVLLRATFADMCHIPQPESTFYQWAFRQSHNNDAKESGAEVFHLLNLQCRMFDLDPTDNSTSVPVPDEDQVMAVIKLIDCRHSSLMLAFGLRRQLRMSPVEGRQIFWLVHNTLMDLAGVVSGGLLKTSSFLDRAMQLMSTMRAQRGATGAVAHTGVFPSRLEVNYAMLTYASQIREAARSGGAGLPPITPVPSPLRVAMHRLDRLFQGLEKPSSSAIEQPQHQPLPQPSPLLLSRNNSGIDSLVFMAAAAPLTAPEQPELQQSSDAYDDDTTPTSVPMTTARILRRPPATCPAFAPVDLTIRPYIPYPPSNTSSSTNGPVPDACDLPLEPAAEEPQTAAADAFSAQPAFNTTRGFSQPQAPALDSLGPTPALCARPGNARQPGHRRVPPLAVISCNDVTELLQEENLLHEKFIHFVARYHDNVSEYGIRHLDKLVQQHRDLVYNRQQQQRRKELAARLRTSSDTPYYSHNQPPATTQVPAQVTAQTSAQPPLVNGGSGRSSSDTGSGIDGSGYTYIDVTGTGNGTAYDERNFGNVFNAPPAPNPYAHHIQNQPGRRPQQSQRNYGHEVASPAPPPPPPYESASQLLQPVFGPPIPYNLMLPSLDQTDMVAPRPLRPTLPALVMSTPVPGTRTLMETQPHIRVGSESDAALLEALHTLPPVPLAEQNELVRQQYERYHQQQQYQLELQKQKQEQDKMMQTYQEQQLQHQRQILAQQTIIQREQLAQLEYMQHQHQMNLLRSLRMHVLQQIETQRQENRAAQQNHSGTDSPVDGYAGYAGHVGNGENDYNVDADANADADDDMGMQGEVSSLPVLIRADHAASNGSIVSIVVDDVDTDDDGLAVTILSRDDDDHGTSYEPPAILRGRGDNNPSLPIFVRNDDPGVEDPEPPRYTPSRNHPFFGYSRDIPVNPATASASPFRTAMVDAIEGVEGNGHNDGHGEDDGGQNAHEDAILYD